MLGPGCFNQVVRLFQSCGSVESSPSSSPGSGMAGAGVGPGGSTAHPALSIPNGAPKFGTLVPNR